MRFRTTIEIVALDGASESATLRVAYNINDIAIGELVDQNLVSNAGGVIGSRQPKFFENSGRRNPATRLFEMTAHRLCHVFQLDRTVFDEPELNRVVAILAA